MSSSLFDYVHGEKQERIADDVTLQLKQDEALLLIAEKGVAFPTEISRDIDLNTYSVNAILYNCNRLGFIQKIYPDPEMPQPQFRGRMQEFWAIGMTGYPTISRFSWWTLTTAGFWFIKEKFKGSHKLIRGSLIKPLKLVEEIA